MKNHIFFLFIVIGVTAENKAYVDFSGSKVIVSCGDNGDIYYTGMNSDARGADNSTLMEPYDYNPLKYFCKSEDSKPSYTFFIKAKVCDNCHELDGPLVVGVICGDLLITGGIILIVYLYGQRKSGPAPQKPTNARRPAGSSGGPPVPSPDYQPLSDFTRSKDTYATVHKTG